MTNVTLQQKLAALVQQVGTDVQSLTNEMTVVEAEVEQNLTVVRSGVDANNLFTTLTWKRSDGTVYKTSVLSGGTTPQYTTRTTTYYAANGTTIKKVFTHTLAYSNGLLISETLN